MDRRSFLKTGTIGAAAALTACLPRAARAETVASRRALGRTGLDLSVVGMGALLTLEPAIFQAAFDRGVNYVDTARVYMQGRNESIVGKALKGYRDQVFLATKFFPGPKEQMRQDIDASLAALDVDYVDLLQIHKLETVEQVHHEDYREVLAEAVKQGKARNVGLSTHKNMALVLNAVAEDPDPFYETALVVYNFNSHPEIGKAIARAAQAGVGVIAMKTQAGGYETQEMGDVSPHQAALKWVLQDTNVTATVPSMSNLAQVRENTAVMGMTAMTSADAATLRRYGDAIQARYCHCCGECEDTCPAGVDIPEVSRCLMYAQGYHQTTLARETHAAMPPTVSSAACHHCTQCTAQCAHGLDLPARMHDAAQLFA